MASFCKGTAAILIIFILLLLASSPQARKLHYLSQEEDVNIKLGLISSAADGSIIPLPSSPGTLTSVDAQPISQSNVDRMLGSVPSPGVGH
ncbi:hypothetical protein Cni_G17903 [Canna indica]|uniref:Uncharacterized protein n=1 Tax=Canna indica TaxID=4628 RepID=A0AAQ3QI69_9LILI|nr:hypothetical protein Cni_G17903 [Canna indica]